MVDENTPDMARFLFPYESIRPIQHTMMETVEWVIKDKKHLLMHAPTGIGKTIGVLGPALRFALDNKKKVFFLTSRHTQHLMAIRTLEDIKDSCAVNFDAVDIIGKKWMCAVPEVETLFSNEFAEYCKKQREDGACEFYSNTKQGNKVLAQGKLALEECRAKGPLHVEAMKEICESHKVCPYEIAAELAKDAQVIVADYFYGYNARIRDLFLNKINSTLDDFIVVVDEGHNLPERIRSLMSFQLTNNMIKRGIQEAKKLDDSELIGNLSRIQDILNKFSDGLKSGGERFVEKTAFIQDIKRFVDYDDFVEALDSAGSIVRKESRSSTLSSIANFLDEWTGDDVGYVRFINVRESRGGLFVSLCFRCLDPSKISADAIAGSHSTILMSGTLNPPNMYRDVLGFPDSTMTKVFGSPFPEENRINMVIPKTTTKYSARSDQQYKNIAQVIAQITDSVPGNSAVFFPSYYLRDQVNFHLQTLAKKTVLPELPDMTKTEKSEFLERFAAYKKSGAVLLGAVSGSFGEGIDFPGDLLKCVVVVGLPLQVPTLETKKLIDYYDQRFGKGWDYGYTSPAMAKCFQNAGRCIRSETDRGMIIFLDERYAWSNYFSYFPHDWNVHVCREYVPVIKEFFSR